MLRTCAPLLAFFLLAACDDSELLHGNLLFAEANNYAYQAQMNVESYEVASGGDLLADWSAITTDLQGRQVQQVDVVSIIDFSISIEQLLEDVASNSLLQSDIRDYRIFDASGGETAANLSEFSILGNDFVPSVDFVEQKGTHTWLLSLWDQEREGRDDILASMHLLPLESAQLAEVAFDDHTASFSFQPDLQSLQPLRTSSGLGSYLADWSDVDLDASGHEFDDLLGDRLMVAQLDAASVAEVEGDFIDIFYACDNIWRLDVYGETDANLMLAEDADGGAFPGFSAEGVWLLGIECTSCTSPVPLIMTVVEPV